MKREGRGGRWTQAHAERRQRRKDLGLKVAGSSAETSKSRGCGSTCFTTKLSNSKSNDLGLESPHRDMTNEMVFSLQGS